MKSEHLNILRRIPQEMAIWLRDNREIELKAISPLNNHGVEAWFKVEVLAFILAINFPVRVLGVYNSGPDLDIEIEGEHLKIELKGSTRANEAGPIANGVLKQKADACLFFLRGQVEKVSGKLFSLAMDSNIHEVNAEFIVGIAWEKSQ